MIVRYFNIIGKPAPTLPHMNLIDRMMTWAWDNRRDASTFAVAKLYDRIHTYWRDRWWAGYGARQAEYPFIDGRP